MSARQAREWRQNGWENRKILPFVKSPKRFCRRQTSRRLLETSSFYKPTTREALVPTTLRDIEEKRVPVVDYFIIDTIFPSGTHESLGESHLHAEFRNKYPGAYVIRARGEAVAKMEMVKLFQNASVVKVLSTDYREVTVGGGYWMCYWHIRFVPAEGHWAL